MVNTFTVVRPSRASCGTSAREALSPLTRQAWKATSITASRRAAAIRSRAVASGRAPSRGWGMAKSTIVVVPPQAAARVQASKSSRVVNSPSVVAAWTWGSTPPGTTNRPSRSSVWVPPGSDPGRATTAIFSPSTPTSARTQASPSVTCPSRRIRSNPIRISSPPARRSGAEHGGPQAVLHERAQIPIGPGLGLGPRDDGPQLLHLALGGVGRTEACDGRLQRDAGFDQLPRRPLALGRQGQHPAHPRPLDPDERARSGPHVDQARQLQGQDPLPGGEPADAQTFRQLPIRGEPVTRAELTVTDGGEDRLDDVQVPAPNVAGG